MAAARFLGVDGGGTSTVAWLAGPGGQVLGRGTAGPSNAKAVGLDAARAALQAAIVGAFRDAGLERTAVDVACLGVAGFGRDEDRELLKAWSAESDWARRLVLVTDGDLVLAAGTPEGCGVAVIAGTGSIAVGRNASGDFARCGGWGYLLGDEGSAYRVVLDALALVMRRYDGRELVTSDPDPLQARLLRALDAKTVPEIITRIYAPEMTRSHVAGLAPEVMAAVDEDPSLLGRLVEPAASQLGEMIDAVARSLALSGPELPLATAGGFLLASEALLASLVADLRRRGWVARVGAVPEPVAGAVILAERSAAT